MQTYLGHPLEKEFPVLEKMGLLGKHVSGDPYGFNVAVKPLQYVFDVYPQRHMYAA